MDFHPLHNSTKEPPMIKFAKQLFAGEEGATMVEYALMVALIGAALVTVVTTLGTSISAKFTSVSNTISGS
jgi:pilus assembly protein Flp/PilA